MENNNQQINAFGKIFLSACIVVYHEAVFEMARGEWVLQIDADEFLTEKATDSIRRLLCNPGPCNGFSLLYYSDLAISTQKPNHGETPDGFSAV